MSKDLQIGSASQRYFIQVQRPVKGSKSWPRQSKKQFLGRNWKKSPLPICLHLSRSFCRTKKPGVTKPSWPIWPRYLNGFLHRRGPGWLTEAEQEKASQWTRHVQISASA